ncbi:MAG: PilW family protein [Candidatus Sedimenticola sp. 4PFRAG1]
MNMRNMKQQGLGLVEIMIAMVLGLVLTIGMTEIFIANKQAHKSQESLSHIQENARFAIETMARNIRMAGYMGCANLDAVPPNVIADPPPSGGFSAATAVMGSEVDDAGAWAPVYDGVAPVGVVKGTDVIRVGHADDCGAYLVGNMKSDNANIQVNSDNTCGFEQGDHLLITDCKNADLFRAGTVSVGASSGKLAIPHPMSVNIDNRLSTIYGPDARVYKFIQIDYYIKENPFGEPSLYRRSFGVEEELVEGIEDLEITYGEDETNDLTADRYVDANVVGTGAGQGWGKVTGVRVQLGLRSIRNNVALGDTTYVYDGANVTNRRLRQNTTFTVGLRNRSQ